MHSVPDARTSFAVGEEATFSKTFTQEDVEAFSKLSGDTNPIHLDENYARRTRFDGRIIHGMLVASLISCFGHNTAGSRLCVLESAIVFSSASQNRRGPHSEGSCE